MAPNVDDGLVRSSRLGSPGVGGVPGQRGGGEAGLHHSGRLLLPPPWTICPSGMVVVGGTNGDPQGQGLHLAADRCPVLLSSMQGQRGCGTGLTGGGFTSSARGQGLRETTAAPLRPPRGCRIHRPRGENDHQEEEPQSFYAYLRSMVLPSNYLPLGARLGFELW